MTENTNPHLISSASDTPVGASQPPTRKGERTRARILETALDLFRERGYEQTTMRAIAEAAGVSLGNAYYYFRSKEHLIQAFYGRTHVEHLEACRGYLEMETDLRARLAGVLRAKFETSKPYHQFSGLLFKTAADPASPLSPFSPESEPVRRDATELFAEVVSGSSTSVPDELMEELPHLLWLYQMGLILFWIHDTSEGCGRSYLLLERTADIVARLIRFASRRPFRPLARGAVRLVRELRTFDADRSAVRGGAYE